MRRFRGLALSVAAALVLSHGPAAAQEAPQPWRTKAESVPIHYTIDATLVETGFGDGVRIVGDETILWRNTSREPVKVLYLHTYANAFRNTRSTFLREAVRDEFKIPDDMRWGDMAVARMSSLVHGDELKPEWRSPDDGNPDDRTVLRVELPDPVESTETIAIKVAFTLEMPRVIRRMGASHGFVMAAQWFPKLGMYVGTDSTMRNVREGWYCHQYHANCEFAADFADYDVTLHVPPQYVVGATGVPGVESVDGKGLKTRQYKAESVVDFAWTASRQYVEIVRSVTPIPADRPDDPVAVEAHRVAALLNLPAEDAALPPVQVVLLVQPEHLDQADRMFEAARVALGFFGTWMGPYPYGRLTIVDPPWNAMGAAGMEYPMLVTAGTADDSPAESQRPEGVTVHEICHQWLMGLLANNEAEEAWLDEGVNSYVTALAMDAAFAPPRATHGPAKQYTSVLGFHFPFAPIHEFPGIAAGWPDALDLPKWARPPEIDALRLWRDLPPLSYVPAWRYGTDPMLPYRRSWLRRAGVDEMVKSGWTYADRTSYAVNAYSRPALFLNTLRRSLTAERGAEEGDRRFVRALREYAREFRFRHPTSEDLLRKFRELAIDPTRDAEQLVRAASTLDYSIESIRSGSDPDLVGFDENGQVRKADQKEPGKKEPKQTPKSSIVRVMRRGEAVVPVTLEVTREDGTTKRVRWEVADQAKERWRDFRFDDGAVVSARLDPDGVYLQDGDLSNNSYVTETSLRPTAKWSVRFVGWLENAFLSYGRFF